ncbi:hypothetical protein J6590_084080 [Homalodisca vitripennis]|nr:hypothetical protein J6590_084080 [Homalodisca vitripennis]
MNSDSDVKLQCRQVAEEFNNYFAQVGYNLARAIDSSGPPVVDDNDYTVNTEFSIHTITETELHGYVTSMRGGSAPGLRSMTAHHFVLRQWKSLVQLLESALLRQVSLTSLQAVAHGDLDILLTITGGVELAVLSEALQSAGLSGANWSCDCHNGALCRQKVQIQRDLVFTVATDHVSFVCPGHSHQLYCACNLGYGGEYCEEILPGGDCGCPPPQGCMPQAGAPGGYICVPPSCPPSHSCPPAVTASIHWEELVAIVVAILIVSCLVLVFVLYRRCHRISPGNRVDKSELNHVIKRTSKLSNLQVTQPSRPTSYTCSSNNEVFSAVALNNAERGTAESDNVPPDYRRNLMSPHHKINNDLKQTADIPLHQVIPAEDDTRTIGGSRAIPDVICQARRNLYVM